MTGSARRSNRLALGGDSAFDLAGESYKGGSALALELELTLHIHRGAPDFLGDVMHMCDWQRAHGLSSGRAVDGERFSLATDRFADVLVEFFFGKYIGYALGRSRKGC
ncbi:hypothetical protein ACX80D_03070 [Arthrobacter sp. Sr24]